MKKLVSVMLLAGLPMIVAAYSASFGPAVRPQDPTERQERADRDLESLLKKASEYCRKLEGAALDFVCREEIKEMINPALDNPPPFSSDANRVFGVYPGLVAAPPKVKNIYVYDYQCIRAAGKISETRILLEENGKKKNEPNAKLKTEVFIYGTPLLGPVGLFAERFQKDYRFSIAGNDVIDQRPVIVINAEPKPGAPETTNLYGKAWMDPATAEILKIEWSEARVGHYEIFEKRGRHFDRKPRVTLRSEFLVKKNGICFLSRLFIEEAYLDKQGRAFVRSEIDVRCKDFKFFPVEASGDLYELVFVRNEKKIIDTCNLTTQGMAITGKKIIKS
jgi:hypothetical protein